MSLEPIVPETKVLAIASHVGAQALCQMCCLRG